MRQLAKIFRALADPTRLRILNLLLIGPGCVCELQELLELPQSLISRHLAHLRNAGFVDDERIGMRVRYRLRSKTSDDSALRRFLSEALSRDEGLRREAEAWKKFHQCCGFGDESITATSAA